MTSCYLSPEKLRKRKRPCFHDPDPLVSIIIFLISAIIAIGQVTTFITLNKSVQTYVPLSFHTFRTTSSLQYLSMSITICTIMPITKYVIIISLSFIKVSVLFAKCLSKELNPLAKIFPNCYFIYHNLLLSKYHNNS